METVSLGDPPGRRRHTPPDDLSFGFQRGSAGGDEWRHDAHAAPRHPDIYANTIARAGHRHTHADGDTYGYRHSDTDADIDADARGTHRHPGHTHPRSPDGYPATAHRHPHTGDAGQLGRGR